MGLISDVINDGFHSEKATSPLYFDADVTVARFPGSRRRDLFPGKPGEIGSFEVKSGKIVVFCFCSPDELERTILLHQELG